MRVISCLGGQFFSGSSAEEAAQQYREQAFPSGACAHHTTLKPFDPFEQKNKDRERVLRTAM